jgi:hypothetical protein
MKLLIVITCILANGQQVHPRGSYTAWAPCNKYVEYFETQLYPTAGNNRPLCWCHRAPPEREGVPAPSRAIHYDEDRKAPAE